MSTLPLRAVSLLFSGVPPFAGNALRTRALQLAGLRVGRATLFWGMPALAGELRWLSIGAHCGFNVGCCFELHDAITIGDHVSVGHEVTFLTRPGEPVTIGDGAWLGARATISPGVSVGAGAVVGAGVVVTTNIPADTLVSGAQRLNISKWRAAPSKRER